jgi:hypothetical protein
VIPYLKNIFADKWEAPGDDILEIREDIWVLDLLDLLDLEMVVLCRNLSTLNFKIAPLF